MKEGELSSIQAQWAVRKIAEGWKDAKQKIYIIYGYVSVCVYLCLCVCEYNIILSIIYHKHTYTGIYRHTHTSSMHKTVTFKDTYFQEQKVNKGYFVP